VARPATPQSRSEGAILVVDADPHVVELLTTTLEGQGFEVYTAADGPAALDRALAVQPDAVILEVTLPGIEDFALLHRLRAHGVEAPGLFLTARTLLRDRLTGLTVGGDDYISKPFSPEEVVARLRAILRRIPHGGTPTRTALTCADLELNEHTHEAQKAGQSIKLTSTEFELLRYLMINTGIVLSKSTIRDHVWRSEFRVSTNSVESSISTLRRKIDTGDTRFIHTVRGLGYVLREPN
jgi:two-component system OmpR family response regulator